MSLVDATGKQISEGPTGRGLVITEHIKGGSPTWGIEFIGFEGGMDTFEVLQVLADVQRAICIRQRQAIKNEEINQKIVEKLKEMGKDDK